MLSPYVVIDLLPRMIFPSLVPRLEGLEAYASLPVQRNQRREGRRREFVRLPTPDHPDPLIRKDVPVGLGVGVKWQLTGFASSRPPRFSFRYTRAEVSQQLGPQVARLLRTCGLRYARFKRAPCGNGEVRRREEEQEAVPALIPRVHPPVPRRVHADRDREISMSGASRLRAGLIGLGVGKLYAAALASLHHYYPELPAIELVALATATEDSARRGVEQFGFQRASTDYRELLEAKDLDLVVIATPPDLHLPMLESALATRMAIYIDKPLARSLAEARRIWRLAQSLGRDAQMIFQFRHVPALYRARDLVGDGRLGELFSFRVAYLRSSYLDPLQPLRWKGSLERSGGGSLNDTAPHALDLLSWIAGTPTRLAAQARTFVEERPVARGDTHLTTIDTDDHVILLAAMANQAIGTVEAGRMVAGSVHDFSLELHGSRASLRWSLLDANHLYWAEARASGSEVTWEQIPTLQRYPGASLPGWDVPLGMMRFHVASLGTFVQSIQSGSPFDPGLEQGVRVQAMVEAAGRAAASSRWEEVEPIV